MGKRKRMIQRCSPARERSADLRAELPQYGVKDVWDLPVNVHWYHRALRLQQAVRA